MFLTRPYSLKLELKKTCKNDIESISLAGECLRLTCQTETKKTQIRDTLTHIGGKPVEVSEPRALTRPTRTVEDRPEPIYDLKIVIHGLLEEDEILKEIASEIGAKYMKRLGGPDSKTVLIGYAKETVLPDTIVIDGRRFRTHTYVPRPLRCRICQQFSHHESKCNNTIKCTRCGRDHAQADCPDVATARCINCAGPHDADDKKCPKYIKIQKALEIRARENIRYTEAYELATQELKHKEHEKMQTMQTNTTDRQNTTEPTVEDEQETFTNLIKTSPYTVNKTDKYKDPITEYTRITELQTCRFVLGVLGALKNKT